MPLSGYATGGCNSCRAGVPAPPPAQGAPTIAAQAAAFVRSSGLPWWVWVLGILTLASFFRGRRG